MKRKILMVLAGALTCAPFPLGAQTGSPGIVISQVYGGGGSFGVALRNDFVELFNRGNVAVRVDGWTVQYSAPLGSAWDKTVLSGVIQPGQYYLVQEGGGNGGANALPIPDATGDININATDGKVALVSNSTALTVPNPAGAQVVDLVGWGGSNFYESFPAPVLSNAAAAFRQSEGCVDTNNNRADFTASVAFPRNSPSTRNVCAFTFGQPPALDAARILNSASLRAGESVAPGSLVSIFGANFANSDAQASSIPLPTTLGNVTVTFNGIAAPISSVFHDAVNGDQINIQVPWEMAAVSATTLQVEVSRDSIASGRQAVPYAAISPGIFAIQISGGKVVGAGSGQAIAYSNSDNIIAAPAGVIDGLTTRPARVGDPNTLVILATGLGPVDSSVKSGDVPPVLTSNTLVMPQVSIGGVPAQVVFCGMVGRDSGGKALGYVGVYQINVIVAPGTPTGAAVPVTLTSLKATSRPGVTIALQ